MLDAILKKIFGTKHERDVKRLTPNVEAINALEPATQALSEDALRAKTDEFRARLARNVELNDVLVEAFAVCREAARRTVGMRHFDVQLIGGMVLHSGTIAEMATGEGKTLVATLPAYLNALPARGVHIVTVNDYLAKRDAQWMGPIYHALGLSIGVIQHEASFRYDPTYVTSDIRMTALRPCTRPEAYRADITYGTNNEFGFDYLRDNMRFTLEELVQRELYYAIVDEVDSILIDEARTPLIISGPADESTDLYYKIDRIIPKLRRAATIVEGKLSEIEAEKKGDFIVDEKARAVALTEEGIASCERLLNVENLYDPQHIDVLHHVQQGLRAHTLYKRDVDYVVKDGEVIIVDEFTGRLMPGRRWSDGLHQAVEAKEGARIERENQTLATITIQNYFRMYGKLAGMTGTADTEAVEFRNIYKLDVVVIPPNKAMRRVDNADVVYKSEREKFNAVVEEIGECHQKGQPVLVGTTSVEKSERVSKLLKKAGVKHNVLNAINHEAEANIIAQGGRWQQVTIATNMAGRGTDILLGGNPEFLARAEMENEWIRNSTKLAGASAGAARYEDALRGLREKYDEELQRLQEQHGAVLAELAQRRSAALAKLTEADRKLRNLSPYRAVRARYEEVSSVELIPAIRDHDPIPVRYARVKKEMEASLLEAGDAGAIASERSELESVRVRYDETLRRWSEDGQRDDDIARELNECRSEYERSLAQLELAVLVKGPVAGNGELATWRQTYEEAEQAYIQIEREHDAAQAPFEEGKHAAERRYEDARIQYVSAVEEIREQLQKAPQEYEERFRESLARFQELCAAEREKVVDAGGLHIIGTERHEARRIDNQLRGRAGRQGDP